MPDPTNPIFKFTLSINGGTVAEWFCLVAALTWFLSTALSVWQEVLRIKIARMKKEPTDADE